MEQTIDLFEDYNSIPSNVREVLDRHHNAFDTGCYRGLNDALKELESIGYTFDYYLDGSAYDLRPMGIMGKTESDTIN
jgi:hypothetical protein